MFKKLIITAIDIYQVIFSILLKNLLGVSRFCRFDETCSIYAKRAILEEGLTRGSWLSFIRILKCQPLTAK